MLQQIRQSVHWCSITRVLFFQKDYSRLIFQLKNRLIHTTSKSDRNKSQSWYLFFRIRPLWVCDAIFSVMRKRCAIDKIQGPFEEILHALTSYPTYLILGDYQYICRYYQLVYNKNTLQNGRENNHSLKTFLLKHLKTHHHVE